MVASILELIAEVSTALIGFAGIVTAFQRSTTGAWPAHALARFWSMVYFASGALVFSLGALIYSSAGVVEASFWSWASLPMALYIGAQGAILRIPPAERKSFNPFLVAITGAGSVGAIVVLLANALRWPFEPSATAYLVGLFWLVVASVMFFLRQIHMGLTGEVES